MNRGRHKKQSFPHGEYVGITIIYFNNHPNVQRRSYIHDYRKFANEALLNYQILKWMTDKHCHVLEVQIRYNLKTIRTYKRHQFHNHYCYE